MTIADQILADLRAALAGRKLPRVRSLHLPASTLRQSKDGEFGALALDDGSLGLSYLLLGSTLAGLDRGDHRTALAGTDALELAARWADPDPVWQAVGFAAVNALTRHLMDAAGFAPASATDSIAGLDPQPGEAIGMVGFFPPLVPQIVARGARLTVLELRTDLVGERDGYTVTLDPAALAPCRKVLATSTVLLNRSFDAIADAVRGAEVFALVGPSAGCLPDALFRRGVTRIGGTWVSDPAGLVAAIESGTPWGANARKFSLERAGYPGWPALVAAAGR